MLGGLFLIKAPQIHLTPNIDYIIELPNYDRHIAQRALNETAQRAGGINYDLIARQFIEFKREAIPNKQWSTLLSPSRRKERLLDKLWKEYYPKTDERSSYSYYLSQFKGAFLEQYALDILQHAYEAVAPENEANWIINPWVQKPPQSKDRKDRALYREGDIIIGLPHETFYGMMDWIGKEHPATIQACPVMRKWAERKPLEKIAESRAA